MRFYEVECSVKRNFMTFLFSLRLKSLKQTAFAVHGFDYLRTKNCQKQGKTAKKQENNKKDIIKHTIGWPGGCPSLLTPMVLDLSKKNNYFLR